MSLPCTVLKKTSTLRKNENCFKLPRSLSFCTSSSSLLLKKKKKKKYHKKRLLYLPHPPPPTAQLASPKPLSPRILAPLPTARPAPLLPFFLDGSRYERPLLRCANVRVYIIRVCKEKKVRFFKKKTKKKTTATATTTKKTYIGRCSMCFQCFWICNCCKEQCQKRPDSCKPK
jgi:hypothetical protein